MPFSIEQSRCWQEVAYDVVLIWPNLITPRPVVQICARCKLVEPSIPKNRCSGGPSGCEKREHANHSEDIWQMYSKFENTNPARIPGNANKRASRYIVFRKLLANSETGHLICKKQLITRTSTISDLATTHPSCLNPAPAYRAQYMYHMI
jgi:hypothetical protein